MLSKCFLKLDKTMLPASTHSKCGSNQRIFRMLLFLASPSPPPPRVAELKGKPAYPLLQTQLTYTKIFPVKQNAEVMLWDSRARLLLRCVCNGWLSSELCAKQQNPISSLPQAKVSFHTSKSSDWTEVSHISKETLRSKTSPQAIYYTFPRVNRAGGHPEKAAINCLQGALSSSTNKV